MKEEDLKPMLEECEGLHPLWVKAIKEVYLSYPAECLPTGLCDMAYMINVISHKVGLSDGKGNFKQVKA